VGGGVLDARERLVDLEGLSHVLSELRAHIVLGQAARERRTEVSAAADSRKRARGGILELLEGLVLLEALGQMLGGLRVQSVVAETANRAVTQSAVAAAVVWAAAPALRQAAVAVALLAVDVAAAQPSPTSRHPSRSWVPQQHEATAHCR